MNSPVRLGVSPAASTHTSFFSQGFEVLFPHAGTLGNRVCLVPQLFLTVYPHANVGPPAPPAAALPTSPLHPGYMSLPVIQVWMNVSSLTLRLLDFHTVQFSGSSGCFYF